MASITITREDLFPSGTTVNAYEAIGLGQTPTSGPPPGSSAGSGIVSSGVLTITGLDSGKVYILYAPTPDRYLRVSTMEGATVGGADVNTATIPSVCAWNGTHWTFAGAVVESRPSVDGIVWWIGGGLSADPNAGGLDYALQGDVWTPSEPVA